MKDVGPATRRLLDAAGPIEPPPPEVVERMWKGVAAQAAAAPAASSAMKAQSVGHAALAGNKAKLIAALIVLGGGATVFSVQRGTPEVPRPPQDPPQQVAAPPTPGLAPDSRQAEEAAPATEHDGPVEADMPKTDAPAGRRARRLKATPDVDPSEPVERASKGAATSPLDRELKLIRAAQSALASGDLSRASLLVERHARQFPNGALTEERLGIQALVHCRNGGDGGPAARRLEREMSASPIAQRVRERCGRESKGVTP